LLWVAIGSVIAFGLGSKYIAFDSIGPSPVVLDPALTSELVRTSPQDLQLAIPEPARRSIVMVIPSVLEFKLVLNPGAVFGSGQGKRWLFVGFTFVALGFCLFVFARLTRRSDWLTHIAIGSVAGGGLGNLYDRLVYACVRDVIHPLPGVEWPFGWTLLGRRDVWPYVSNVADAVLLIGIGYLVVKLWRHEDTQSAAGDRIQEQERGD